MPPVIMTTVRPRGSAAILALALLAALAVTAPADAQQAARIRYFTALTVTNAMALTVCSGDATCTADVGRTQAFVTVETNPIRWRADGTAPTTTIGHLANAGASITITGQANVSNFSMIATGASAAVYTSVMRP